MSGNELIDQPQHDGSKAPNSELVRRPNTPPDISIPRRPYNPNPRAYSPERTPTEEPEPPRSSGGLRRRPSANFVSQSARRWSGGEYDHELPAFSAEPSSRKMSRARDDQYYRDEDYDRYYPPRAHPDQYERSRPPRTYRNVDGWDKPPGTASKPFFDESRSDYYRDLEKGLGDTPSPPRRRKKYAPSDESVDGYDYEKANKSQMIDLKNMTPEERAHVMRLPFIQWMNSDFKNHFVATIGEFVGTTMFLFFAFAGTQVANIGSAASEASSSTANTTSGGATGFNVSVQLYIAVIFGFSLMVNVWIFFRISGGLFNPAVTLGMVLVGALPIVRALCLFAAQIVGSIAASAMVVGLFPTPFNVRTTLAGDTSKVQGVFIEAFLTAELVFTIFMLAKEKHKATFIAPVGIGLALFIAEMVGVFYTGGSLNPARSFGPCVVTGTFDTDHWIYWVGPVIGALIATFFYKFIKMLEYEMANPGQDGDPYNDPTQNPEKRQQIQEEKKKVIHPLSRRE